MEKTARPGHGLGQLVSPNRHILEPSTLPTWRRRVCAAIEYSDWREAVQIFAAYADVDRGAEIDHRGTGTQNDKIDNSAWDQLLRHAQALLELTSHASNPCGQKVHILPDPCGNLGGERIQKIHGPEYDRHGRSADDGVRILAAIRIPWGAEDARVVGVCGGGETNAAPWQLVDLGPGVVLTADGNLHWRDGSIFGDRENKLVQADRGLASRSPLSIDQIGAKEPDRQHSLSTWLGLWRQWAQGAHAQASLGACDGTLFDGGYAFTRLATALLPLFDLGALRPPGGTSEDFAFRESCARRLQERCTLIFSWAIPNCAALRAIARIGMSIVEIGAGTGYWANLLQSSGIHVTAAWDRADEIPARLRHPIVSNGGPEMLESAVFEHAKRRKADDHSSLRGHVFALLLCWPDNGGEGSFALQCLNNYHGDAVIFVGERPEYCSAPESCFCSIGAAVGCVTCVGPPPHHGNSASIDFLTVLGRDFELTETVPLPSWPHAFLDSLTVWRRRGQHPR